MIENHLTQCNFSVTPTDEEESKRINIVHMAGDTMYVLPLQAKAIEELVKQLTMTNQELIAYHERRQAAKQLEVPADGQGAMFNPEDLRSRE